MKSSQLIVDLKAILYNYRNLVCTYNKKIIAVLKDNAYGMGLIPIAKALQNEPHIIFAINSIEEASLLRNNGITNPIILLGVFEKSDLQTIKKLSIEVILNDIKQLPDLYQSGIPFHIKINTGMNRLGLSPTDYNKVFPLVYKNISYNLVGLMSHFASDDHDHVQYNKFQEIILQYSFDNLIIHCFSSSSLRKESLTTHARIGIKLYGLYKDNCFHQQAIKLLAPIIHIVKVNPNDQVGYDFSYTVKEKGYLYIVPIGYSKGYGRYINSKAYVKGDYLLQAGKNSMDYSCFFSKNRIKKESILELFGLNVSMVELSIENNICLHQMLTNLRNINITYL